MNQTLLFLIGTGVFAVTLVGVMQYGFALVNRAYEADIDAQQPGIDGPPSIDASASPVPAATLG